MSTTYQPVRLSRPVEVTEIPSGIRGQIPEGTVAKVMQSLGNAYTIMTEYGYMYRVDAKDADALGIEHTQQPSAAAASGKFSEELAWEEMKTVYDPEIPVNIVDLGLVYELAVADAQPEGKKLDIKMTMTAPGCGMGNILKADVENRLSKLPEVKEVHVEVVFDPPWTPQRMTEAARLQLGLDI